MKIQIQRSHFSFLLLGASNVPPVEEWWASHEFFTGWSTNFDGGGNTHTPNEFAAVVLRTTPTPDDERSEVTEVTMLRVHERFTQDRNDKNWARLYRHRKPETAEVEMYGEGFFEPDPENWERIAEEQVGESELKALNWAIQVLQSLHGQGGDIWN